MKQFDGSLADDSSEKRANGINAISAIIIPEDIISGAEIKEPASLPDSVIDIGDTPIAIKALIDAADGDITGNISGSGIISAIESSITMDTTGAEPIGDDKWQSIDENIHPMTRTPPLITD